MTDSWKVPAFSLATTLGVAYILCTVFDALFPPFGLLAVLAPASPWPISGSLLGVLSGFVLSTAVGFVTGALYGGVRILEQAPAVTGRYRSGLAIA